MRKTLRMVLIALIVLVGGGVVAYLGVVSGGKGDGHLRATGTVEAQEVAVGAELTGRVAEVLVSKGQQVHAGDLLFRLDDTLLQAQRREAEAALGTARAQVEVAQANLEAARLQAQIAEQQAHLAEQRQRLAPWLDNAPADFVQPLWYFTQEERLAAAQQEVEAARQAWEQEQQSLQAVLDLASSANLTQAEERLQRARQAYLAAKAVLDQAKASGDPSLQDQAQAQFDAALDELKAAQTAYDRLLTTKAAQDVLEARARLAVARERYDAALDRWYALQTGEHALSVQAARLAVQQAEKALAQAQAAVAQAQARLDLIDRQLEKTRVLAPTDGVVTALNVDPGEVLQAGATALTLGRLDRLTITVYIPEGKYGTLRLGDKATVTVDSFPGETFEAQVVYIAQQAEYTPRNVQTKEGRTTTVYAVELQVYDPAGKLKPGMPADVDFGVR
ncbi:MAG TPA: HlyD family efflux transporter periplasmic adaptor subunit [Anaerolineae bacterium]|nr:HlyD family efflux transporter periplasmic adaptor subunit [Anaerolineae bacterium]HID83529.1 HlyD family efflux transporter periplasmic adaptor subunit [Anaerolineales bacterium]HIQ08079.1 HlyD family efflux transporter periplasmic adaptor subunit [Anaerolineaceae bacterium]